MTTDQTSPGRRRRTPGAAASRRPKPAEVGRIVSTGGSVIGALAVVATLALANPPTAGEGALPATEAITDSAAAEAAPVTPTTGPAPTIVVRQYVVRRQAAPQVAAPAGGSTGSAGGTGTASGSGTGQAPTRRGSSGSSSGSSSASPAQSSGSSTANAAPAPAAPAPTTPPTTASRPKPTPTTRSAAS